MTLINEELRMQNAELRIYNLHFYDLYNSLIILLLLCSTAIYAQSEYRYQDATQLWRLTDNAAGLAIDSSQNRGYAQLGVEHWDGDYTRVQEGKQTNRLLFETERYQKVGKYLYGYGRFDFDYGRTKGRAWCDVSRPYNAAPYFPGSAIEGKYDFMDFNFTAALGSTKVGNWNFGLRLDYKVNDLSRLRDPRSRSLLLEYKLTPGVAYSIGSRHTIGLAGNYHRRKEKIDGVKTVQTDATIPYYTMSGMEHANATVGGYSSYKREWVNHRFGGELTYAYKAGRYNLLAAASIDRGSENIYGQYMYEEGKYVDCNYGLRLHNRIEGDGVLHEVDVKFAWNRGYADEYRQKYEYESADDKQTKEYLYPVRQPDGTIVYEKKEVTATSQHSSQYYTTQLILRKRYQVRLFNTDVHYRLNFTDAGSVKAYVGGRFFTGDAKNRYILPTSDLHYGSCNIDVEGGLRTLRQRLWIDAGVTVHLKNAADLALADYTTPYAQGVLLPDMAYYNANYWQGRLALTYHFPLKIKGKRTSWYVRAHGKYLHTNNSLSSREAGLTVGLFN